MWDTMNYFNGSTNNAKAVISIHELAQTCFVATGFMFKTRTHACQRSFPPLPLLSSWIFSSSLHLLLTHRKDPASRLCPCHSVSHIQAHRYLLRNIHLLTRFVKFPDKRSLKESSNVCQMGLQSIRGKHCVFICQSNGVNPSV